MTTALLESPARLFAESGELTPVDGGSGTLEERLARAWRSLQACGVAVCPVCRSRMARTEGDRHTGRGGECVDCGSRLS